MKTGTVRFYNKEKGWGFIIPDAGGADLFVHYTALDHGEHLSENDKVSYEVTTGRKGELAINVKKV